MELRFILRISRRYLVGLCVDGYMMMNKKENDVVSFGNRNYDLGFTKYSRHTNPLAELHTLHVNANFTWRTCGLVINSYIFSTRCISGRSSSVEKSSETNYSAEYYVSCVEALAKNFYVIGGCCVENRLALISGNKTRWRFFCCWERKNLVGNESTSGDDWGLPGAKRKRTRC